MPAALRPAWLAWATLAAAVVAGWLVAVMPRTAAVAFAGLGFAVLIAVRPVLGAYLIIGLTPLIVGIDRGRVVPFFRPNEALALAIGSALIGRGVVSLRHGRLLRPRIDAVDVAMVLLAVTSSILPLLWMLARQRQITGDDIQYALVVWKFYGIYLIVRASVTTVAQVRRCLWISMAAAVVVALVAMLQSLKLFGVPSLLAAYYAPFGMERTLASGRGSSTLALAAAVADLMIFNLAIAIGLRLREGRHRTLLACAAVVFVFGTLGSGQFSGGIGLVVGMLALVAVTGKLDLLLPFGAAALIGTAAVWPVIQTRLVGFKGANGLPDSWIGRLNNLRGYFWPELFSRWNFVLGVRPTARVPAPKANGNLWIWIESGYTWLLWGGGIPLLGAYVFFVWATLRRTWETARRRQDAVGVAAIASFVGVVVVTVLMAFDPHITYRGAADALFALLALAGVRAGAGEEADGVATRSRGRPELEQVVG
jgi:hypothetical protein